MSFNSDCNKIDVTKKPPTEEPQRQYYYIEKAKEYAAKESIRLGRKPTFHVTTFGCQMNPENGIV